jgi:NitT/TauT family transport system ATP-binding protein
MPVSTGQVGALLGVEAVSKSFTRLVDGQTQGVKVLDAIDFEVKAGSTTSLFGPNGCGKTTLLNTIAGLLAPDAGRVRYCGLDPEGPRFGFVFQNYRESLFPWLTASDNIAFPLALRGVGRRERTSRVRELTESLEMALPLDLYPYQLSGGQLQMVAIARALITDPEILLLDEPFSALDYQARLQTQLRVSGILEKVKLTALIVSHDPDEAIFLADDLLVVTNIPARVASRIHVRLDRPRSLDMMESAEFLGYRNSVLKSFREVAL